MQSVEFLEKIGKIVTKAEDLKFGDIVGRDNQGGVRLYYVDRIELKPLPPCFTPYCPKVYFKAPHVGLAIIDGKVYRHYIYTPMPGEPYQYCWAESTADEYKAYGCEDFLDECFTLYLIHDEVYKRLGTLIPKVEVPNWGFLYQTTDGEELVYSYVEDIQEDMKQARELYHRIRGRMFGFKEV